MASYNIDKIKAALEAKLNPTKATSNSKLTYWKPTMGEHDVRFLPYADENSQPFQKVAYYEKISDRRFVAPSSFGMDDPIAELFAERRQDKDKEAWKLTKQLKPRDRYYAVIIVRGEEDKGPQIWEFSEDLRVDIYKTLSHKDNADEDMFNPETGYDFTVDVSPQMENGKPKTFNGYPMKTITVKPRKKPSKLGTKDQMEKWLQAIPNLHDYFKSQVKKPEELLEVLENFVNKFSSAETTPSSTKVHQTSSDEATDAKLNDAFGDLA